ncbi:MAG TPA: CopG family transcriptional regulator [Sutterella sp.]|nr:CopG family transcriptional regulator [Sutterella sp.]
MLTLRLLESEEKRLEHLAEATERTKTFYAREAILKYLDEIEDIYLAERVIERVRSGEEKVYSSDEMEKLLAVEV